MRVKAKTAFVTRMGGEAVSVARGSETDLPDSLAQRLADGDIVEIVDVAELEHLAAEKADAEKAAADQAESERLAAEKAEAEQKSAADQVTTPKKRAPANKRVSSAPENK
jgi:hypothetical protein